MLEGIDVGSYVKLRGCIGVVTSRDFAKNEIVFKLFPTMEEALEFKHEWSLGQFPQWHVDNCDICAAKGTQVANPRT